jgi:hypothetical protein
MRLALVALLGLLLSACQSPSRGYVFATAVGKEGDRII